MYFARLPFFIRLLFPRAIARVQTKKKKIYLTFDDGPIPEVTPWVLDILKEEGIHATFFCVGENVYKHPAIFKRLVQEGHKIGNHTYNHTPAFQTKNEDFVKNVAKAQELIKSDLFRPPHGQFNLRLWGNLKKQYKIVFWDVLSCDFDARKTGEQCFNGIKKYVRPGSLIVFHDSLKAEKNLRSALPKTINFLKNEGYTFDVVS